MTFLQLFFLLLALVMLFSAIRVITARNPVHATLYLVLCFFCAGGVWLLLQAEFLAITLVLVYIGAVMVLFLFVVMMLDVNVEGTSTRRRQLLSFGAIFAIITMLMVAGVLFSRRWSPATGQSAEVSLANTRAIGKVLYTDYLLAFELAAVILLVAMLAAVLLTLRKRLNVRRMEPGEQVAVTRQERLRIISSDDPQWKEPA